MTIEIFHANQTLMPEIKQELIEGKANHRSIEKVNAQLPDLNGGVVRLLLQMKKQDSPLIFVVLLLLQMMRLPLQNCIYSYK